MTGDELAALAASLLPGAHVFASLPASNGDDLLDVTAEIDDRGDLIITPMAWNL